MACVYYVYVRCLTIDRVLKNGGVVDFPASCCEETEAILLLRQRNFKIEVTNIVTGNHHRITQYDFNEWEW